MFVYFVLIAVLALTVSQSIILWLVLALAVYLASAQVVIAFLQATKPTELVGSYLSIAQFIRRNGEEKTFSPSSEYNSLPVEQLTESQLTEFASRVQLSFMFAHFCAMFSRQIGAFQESSWRFIPTIFSIMALFASNVILYAFANFALFKIDAGQFAHVPSIKFFDFFYYAFNNLLFNSIGEVGATGTAARLLHISQTATIFFILAVVVGSYMSMRDQAFTDKLKEVSAGFDVLAKEMEQHIEAKFGFGSVEDALAGFEEARMFLLRTFLTFTSESRGRSGS